MVIPIFAIVCTDEYRRCTPTRRYTQSNFRTQSIIANSYKSSYYTGILPTDDLQGAHAAIYDAICLTYSQFEKPNRITNDMIDMQADNATTVLGNYKIFSPIIAADGSNPMRQIARLLLYLGFEIGDEIGAGLFARDILTYVTAFTNNTNILTPQGRAFIQTPQGRLDTIKQAVLPTMQLGISLRKHMTTTSYDQSSAPSHEEPPQVSTTYYHAFVEDEIDPTKPPIFTGDVPNVYRRAFEDEQDPGQQDKNN